MRARPFIRVRMALGTLGLIDTQPRSFDEGGQVEHVMVVVNDITERKRFQRELKSLTATLEQQVQARTADLLQSVEHLHHQAVGRREATQRELRQETECFQNILETTSDAFVEIDAAGQIASWNAAAVRTFGWTREEALGRSLVQTVVPAAKTTPRIQAKKSQWAVDEMLSASIGVAIHDSKRRERAGQLLALADAAMYREKQRKQRASG
jgi:PAS domain-containing protein